MRQIRYSLAGAGRYHDNPLLQAVTMGLAELMPVADCRDWPQPLLDLLARMEHPDVADVLPPPLVMVVGRCPTMTEQAAALLRASALDVVCCETGEAAVQLLKRRAPETALVVTDQQLDGPMDGFALARALGLLWPGLPVLLATDRAPPTPLPVAVTRLDRPWLPLSLLVEAHRALVGTTRRPH